MDINRGREHVVPFPPSTGASQKGLRGRKSKEVRAGGAEANGEVSSYLTSDINDS